MLKTPGIMIMSCILLIAAGVYLSYADEGKTDKRFSEEVTIEPSEFYEKCLTLRPPEVLQYKFESTKSVDFNIHYHGKEGRGHLIMKKGISSFEDKVYQSKYKIAYGFRKKAGLCMIWKNNNEVPAGLSLEFQVDQ